MSTDTGPAEGASDLAAVNPPADDPAPIDPSTVHVVDEEDSPGGAIGFLKAAGPAWMLSTLVHALALIVLAFVTIAPPTRLVNVLTANPSDEEGPEMEEFEIEAVDPGDVQEFEEVSEPIEELTEELSIDEPMEMTPMEFASVEVTALDLQSEFAPNLNTLQTLTSASSSSATLSSRTEDMRKKLLKEYGGTPQSEAAVTEALKWFARHQSPQGYWSFNHSAFCGGKCGMPGRPGNHNEFMAATSLAILPFLGAGQTQTAGDFRGNVYKGLQYMINNGKAGRVGGLPVLDLRDKTGSMYSHGLAAITLCEAYAMTSDPALLQPAQASLNFIVAAQCRDGGWRYTPRQPEGGDTSVAGWQIMALKSGVMGRLSVPPSTIQGAGRFLDLMSSDGGAMYGYDTRTTEFRAGTTAVGLLCRMYMGWDLENEGLARGIDLLGKKGLDKTNLYYNYYAAQVLKQAGGPGWDKFNNQMRTWLVESQEDSGDAAGSWRPMENLEQESTISSYCGRLGATSFCTMMLEVYYRHMPLYQEKSVEEEFPL